VTAPRPVTIVIAEDDEQDYMLAELALRQAGVANPLVRVKDGAELMEFLLRQGSYQARGALPWPLVLLLDLRMPRKDGWEALDEIKSHPRLRKIPVVVLTTSREPDDIARCYELGASSYIKKPMGIDQLLKILDAFRRYWLEVVEFPL